MQALRTLIVAIVIAGGLTMPAAPALARTIIDLGGSGDYSTTSAIDNREWVLGEDGWDGFIAVGESRTWLQGFCGGYGILPRGGNGGSLVAGTSLEEDFSEAWVWENGVATCLPPLEPGRDCSAAGVSLTRQVAGTCSIGGSREAVMWKKDWRSIIRLGTLGGSESTATGINRHRQVVGSSTTATGATHAFLWEEGRMLDLGHLGGDHSVAHAINRNGQVVGESRTASGATHAFLWDQAGGMRDLGSLGGDSVALGLNRYGHVVGRAGVAGGAEHAFLWKNGAMTDLGVQAGFTNSQAKGINDAGVIVGDSSTPTATRAIMWR